MELVISFHLHWVLTSETQVPELVWQKPSPLSLLTDPDKRLKSLRFGAVCNGPQVTTTLPSKPLP